MNNLKLPPFFQKIVILGLLTLMSYPGLNHLVAQDTQPGSKESQLHSLKSGVGIIGLTGNLRWYTYYTPVVNGLEEGSTTELQFNFRNIRMVAPKMGVGYKVFSTVYIDGFFDRIGVGSVGLGPLTRFYPFEQSRWQPYVQAGGIVGYNLALADALGANNGEGIRYRTSLRGGLDYRVTNVFGLYFEIGPTWEYDNDFQLDSRALQINLGIELFKF